MLRSVVNWLAFVCACFACSLSSAAAVPNCPTVDKVPAEIAAAKDLLVNGPPSKGAKGFVPSQVITGIVDFVVERANEEVESWLINSVLTSICTKDPTEYFFPNSCVIYQKTVGALSPSLTVGLTALVSTLRTDAIYAPACLFFREAHSVTGLDPKDVEAVAALGYYYIAVAQGKTQAVTSPKSVQVTLATGGVSLIVGGDTFSITNGGTTLYTLWTAVGAAEQTDYAVAFTTAAEVLTGSSSTTKISPGLQRALEAAIALASAKDADSVQSILDQVASPVGAYAVKQQSSVLSITALPGIQFGRDRLSGAATGTNTASYGFFLPLGVEYSRPIAGGAIGLLLSPVDAGALVSYAQSKTTSTGTVESAPSVTWKSIVAPGAYLAYSFHRSPFVLGAGFQRSPNVRSIELTNGTTTQVPTDRVLVFFAVDVTVFMHAF